MGKCNYCNIDELTHEAKRKIRKNQRMEIYISTNFFHKDVYYLRILPARNTEETIDINFCPFCGRKLKEME